ncbi:tetratricopeptide repeat protein 27-like [Aplysia californica]|uniref:Tetratricopeptide repeat protein 27-like n=1 Tax=Aplysia californica TaxID=6500 RepID=A0ABM0K1D6_APLCA|nr:tetratricopeptide repeat protein 27-like [Aplysia californica]
MTDDLFRDLQILFNVEAGHACHTYFEYRKAADHFSTGKKVAGIHVELSGAMGKRTQFQQDDKAQLYLRVQKDPSSVQNEEQISLPTATPKILPLDDDTVLNEVKYTDDSVTDTPHISQIEQVLIIGLMESYRRSMAQERLTNEEILTYIAFILRHVTNWNVAVMALSLRSKMEQDSRRRVERSMMQLEELAKLAATPDASPGVSQRIPLFYACQVPPLWTVQKDLATILLSLGLTGEALDVFEKLEMWEDAISCYQRMGKMEKAETVIRERLAIKETPALLCFLGDVTREIEHYQKAWEISGHRNARSMRCMGYIHFHQGDYEKAMECFSTSLAVNSLQIPVWFTYGCAAMACQNFSTGVKAFRRCVNIEYDNFEAWSNLSTCYVRLHEKQKAYATLQDALKCTYDNWRLWENNLIIATDCGYFDEVIRSYHRLMDLKDKWVDNEVLNILTRAVLENMPDARGQPSERLIGNLMELFGRITSKVTAEGEIWMNYAKLCNSSLGGRQPDMEKSLQYLQKAYRCITQNSDWEKDVEVCKQVAEQAVSLAKIHVQCTKDKSTQESLRLLSAAKLMLRGAFVKVQKQHTDPISQILSPEVVDVCQAMDECLSQIVSQIDTLRAA